MPTLSIYWRMPALKPGRPTLSLPHRGLDTFCYWSDKGRLIKLIMKGSSGMHKDLGQLRIDANRFQEDFAALSKFGKTSQGGVNRPALSPAHLAARDWLREKIEQAGLEFRQDSAGNLSAYLACGPLGAPSLLLGSHLDSVPTGGRFDGALGVLAGLEVLRCLRQNGTRLPVNLELFDFTDEEGSLVSFFGSFAFAGLLEPENLANPRGGRQALLDGLQRAGLQEEDILSARRRPKTVAGYLELHIEQGPELERSHNQIGVVTDIAGIAFYRLIFKGRPDHAGTIPMEERLDAGLGASAFTLSLREILVKQFPDCYANVGIVRYEPGAFNIVPEKAILSLEFRSTSQDQFERLGAAILERAWQDAGRFGLGLEVQFLGKRDPVEMSPIARQAILQAAQRLGLRTQDLVSRAGHDAQALAVVCPVGMIFVPSVGGVSHSPAELTEWQDCVNGANVLLQAVIWLATRLA
jgi:hydantoinase/carbamoylase family amidase